MRAALRLVWTYFTATPFVRGLSAAGVALILIGVIRHLLLPGWNAVNVMRGRSPGALEIVSVVLPWIGLILLLASSVLMPTIVERIALGRAVRIWPIGRGRLLLSVLLTAGILAVLVAAEATVADFENYYRLLDNRSFANNPYYTYDFGDAVGTFYRTLLMVLFDFGLVYSAIWLVGKTSGVWRLAGVLWIVVSTTVPLRFLAGTLEPFSLLEALGLACWIAFGALLLSGGRVRRAVRPLGALAARIARGISSTARYQAGRELDLMLGVTHPEIVALGQIIPIAVMAALIPESPIWLVVLMLFSALAGAATSQAASRARRLWLRVELNREEIVHRVERAFWRYNAFSLAVLLALYAALAAYTGLPPTVVGHGLLLLALGCAACTYLGLMITGGLGWFESSLCVLTLFALVVAAIATAREAQIVAVEIEVLLAGLAIAYRHMALSRWAALDWMRCRGGLPAHG